MKYYLLLVFQWLTIQTFCQTADTVFDGHQWKAPYTFATPKDWGIERFIVPPSFAPIIQYKGVEDIRFAPGWANATSNEYWSYAFIWFLDGHQQMNAQIIEQNLTHYYTGLVKVNSDPAKIPATGLPATKVQVHAVKKMKSDDASFEASIEMLDYMTQKPLLLHGRIHLKYYKAQQKTIMFYALSPQPFSASIWDRLNQLWTAFRF